MSIHQNSTRNEKGQSLVEFAFSIVVLLLLVSGAVDLGRALYTYMGLRDAAQEGALYGSTNPTQQSEIESRVRNSSNLLQSISADDTANTSVQVIVYGDACTNNAIKVRVAYANFPITMPFLGTFIGNQSIGISAEVTDTILSPSCD
jgi:Flp pilus assembly protein TadG